MNHFQTRSDLVLDNFGLCSLSESQQQEFLRQARPRRSLIVKWLMANDLSRAMRIVLDQPDISFLGAGLVSVEGPIINDGAEILRRWKQCKAQIPRAKSLPSRYDWKIFEPCVFTRLRGHPLTARIGLHENFGNTLFRRYREPNSQCLRLLLPNLHREQEKSWNDRFAPRLQHFSLWL